MTPKSIILLPHELRAALAGTLGHVWRPVNHPPFDPCDEDMGREFLIGNLKPKYQPGDVVAVKETWFYEEHMHDLETDEPDAPGGKYKRRVVYKAGNEDYPVNVGVGANGWRSPATMPAWASRLWMRVNGVVVRRVQDMTGEDARAWGISRRVLRSGCDDAPRTMFGELHAEHAPSAISVAEDIWNHHYAHCGRRLESRHVRHGVGQEKRYIKRTHCWDDNPWCWVTTV